MTLEDKIRQLEEEMSTARGRINTHSFTIRDLNARMLKLEEIKVKNPVYEKTIIQAIEESTNEIVKALKDLHDELIK